MVKVFKYVENEGIIGFYIYVFLYMYKEISEGYIKN